MYISINIFIISKQNKNMSNLPISKDELDRLILKDLPIGPFRTAVLDRLNTSTTTYQCSVDGENQTLTMSMNQFIWHCKCLKYRWMPGNPGDPLPCATYINDDVDTCGYACRECWIPQQQILGRHSGHLELIHNKRATLKQLSLFCISCAFIKLAQLITGDSIDTLFDEHNTANSPVELLTEYEKDAAKFILTSKSEIMWNEAGLSLLNLARDHRDHDVSTCNLKKKCSADLLHYLQRSRSSTEKNSLVTIANEILAKENLKVVFTIANGKVKNIGVKRI
jgi:hypothetical protein